MRTLAVANPPTTLNSTGEGSITGAMSRVKLSIMQVHSIVVEVRTLPRSAEMERGMLHSWDCKALLNCNLHCLNQNLNHC